MTDGKGFLQGVSISNKDLGLEYQSIQPALSNFDATTTAASEPKTAFKKQETVNLIYKKGQGCFGSNIPRFEASAKVQS